jgi:CDP-2,3-bis-(O-geranylgeranyl)-sn-glycerol synthase
MAADLLQVLYFFVPAYAGNMAPVLIRGHLATLAAPIDAGRTFRGRRVLGDHKTWRGLLAGAVAGMAANAVQLLVHQAGLLHALAPIDYPVWGLLPGFLLGAGAGLGDAVKSFFKRQLDIAPGASWLVFDQLDFMAGAAALGALVWAPPLLPFLASLPIVFVGSLLTTITGWRLGLKESWV